MSVETLPSGSNRVIWRDESRAKQSRLFPKGVRGARRSPSTAR